MPIPAPPPATDEQEFTNVRPIGQGKAKGASATTSTSEFTNVRPISGTEDRSLSTFLYSSVPPPSASEKPGAYQTRPGSPIYNANEPDSMAGGVPQFTPREGETTDQTMQRAAEWGKANPDALMKAIAREHYTNVHTAGPATAGAALTMAAGPATGFWARVGLMALGAGGGEAALQLKEHATGDPNAPKSSEQAAKQIGTQAATMGTLEAGGQLLGKAAGPIAKRFLNSRGQAIEDMFRGAGPPTDPNFRTSVETAANDLGLAYQKNPIPTTAKGGIINPDMRVREAVQSINSHLKDMYTQERATQIARGSQMGATVQVATDPAVLQDVSKRLTRTLPINDPSIGVASKLLADPAATLTMDEADALARATNTMLRDYQSMTPAERAAANVTSRKLNGLKQLDQGLSTGINGRLQAIGLPGLQDYEQRYAALSSVRDALQSKMNKAEAARFALRLREFFSPGAGAHGAVSTSLFEKSPGRLVESGMKELSGNATPFAGLPAPPTPKGLLPAPPTEAGWNYEGGAPSAGQPKVWTPQEQEQLRRSQLPPPPPVAQVGGPPPLAGFPPATPSTMWTGSQPKPSFESPTEMTSAARPPANVKGPSVTANAANPTAAASKAAQAPATGPVKTAMTELNMHDLITPRQQKTIATMVAGPQWRSMDSVDKRAAISKIINGATF